MRIHVHDTRQKLGAAAAGELADAMRGLLSAQGSVRMVFAAAPSQIETLHALRAQPGIAWHRVVAFHLDEYLGLPAQAPQRFGHWLRRELFDHLPFAQVHLMRPDEGEVACQDYAALLAEAPIDLVCLGIGTNGHLAFNDPPVADLHDPEAVKVVELERACRRQQVDDECFASIEEVPTHAMTLTIPRILDAGRLVCVVPGAAKRDAVERTLDEDVSEAVPATALRMHPNVTLHLDRDSARGTRADTG